MRISETSKCFTAGFYFEKNGSDVQWYRVPVSQPRAMDAGKYLRLAQQATSHEQIQAICECKSPEDAKLVLNGAAKPTPEKVVTLSEEKDVDGDKPKRKRGRPRKSKPESDDKSVESGGDNSGPEDAKSE